MADRGQIFGAAARRPPKDLTTHQLEHADVPPSYMPLTFTPGQPGKETKTKAQDGAHRDKTHTKQQQTERRGTKGRQTTNDRPHRTNENNGDAQARHTTQHGRHTNPTTKQTEKTKPNHRRPGQAGKIGFGYEFN